MSAENIKVGASADMSTIPSTSTDYSFASSNGSLASRITSATSVDDSTGLSAPGFTVFVDNLEPGTEPLDVMSICGEFGETLNCEMLPSDKPDAVMAKVLLRTQEHAESVVAALNGETADDRVLSVYLDTAPSLDKIQGLKPDLAPSPAMSEVPKASKSLSSAASDKEPAAKQPSLKADVPAVIPSTPVQPVVDVHPAPDLRASAPTFAPSAKASTLPAWTEFKPSGSVHGWLNAQQATVSSSSADSSRSDASTQVDGWGSGSQAAEQGRRKRQDTSESGDTSDKADQKTGTTSSTGGWLASSTNTSSVASSGWDKNSNRVSSPVPSIKSPAVKAAQERGKPIPKPAKKAPEGFVSAEENKKNGKDWSSTSSTFSPPTPAWIPPSPFDPAQVANAMPGFWQSQALTQPQAHYGFYPYTYMAQPFTHPYFPAIGAGSHPHVPNPTATAFTPSRATSPAISMNHKAAPFVPTAVSSNALPAELGPFTALFEKEGIRSMTDLKDLMPDEKTMKEYVDGLRKEYPKILTSYSAAFKLKNQLCKLLGYDG